MDSKYSFYATFIVNVFLDDNDFNLITEICRDHYDMTIRSLVEVGGFLYGFKVRRTPYSDWLPSDEDRVVEFTSNQLGLIMKSFEMQRSEQASILNLMFHKIASEMASTQNFINQNINLYTQKTVFGYTE